MIRALSPSKSLSSKLILFFLIGSVGPMIILTLINTNVASKNMLQNADVRIQARVNAWTERIESYLSERRGDAEMVAALPGIRDSLFDEQDRGGKAQTTAILQQVRDAYGYSAVSVMNKQGIVVLSSKDDLVGKDFSGRSEIDGALRGITSISDVGAKPGEEEVFFHVNSPVYNNDNEIFGLVDLRVSLDELNTIMDFDTNRTGQGSYGVLLDQNLIRISIPANPSYLYHPMVPLPTEVKNRMVEAGRFGSNTEQYLSNPTDAEDVKVHAAQLDAGEEYVIFTGNSGSTGEQTRAMIRKLEIVDWYYIHRVPESTFYAAVNQQTTYAILVTVAAAVISITAMIIFATQTLNRPLQHLVEVAKAIASGDLSRRLSLKREDEIGELADSFNTMADSLQKRIMAEQHAQEESMRLQQAETEVRTTLEQTVADYLQFVQEVANGNLNQRVTSRQDGVLGQLGDGLNGMVESLRMITSQVQEASSNISSASAEIMAATTQQASGATEQSSAITEATTTVEEVKNIAAQVAQQAEQVAKESQGMLNVAHQGAHVVEDTVNSMGVIRQQVESIAQTILGLAEQTQAIGAITKTVSELADQSNMLALNAAIEAARAGEQGKSFAVVAQNVRDLAERSKIATQQVQEILSEIQRASNAAVMVTEEGTKRVEQGVHLSEQAGQVIHQIATEVEQGSQANTQMAAAAHQQTAGMEQIRQAMHSIQQATRESLTSTQQAESAARDLNKLAQTLQDAISVYKL